MSDTALGGCSAGKPDGKPTGRRSFLAIGLSLLLFSGAAFVLLGARQNSSPAGGQSGKAAGADTNSSRAKGDHPFPNRFPAPSLDGGTGWLNASGEITLKDLRGKVVLLDFWTYCCINCIHILPDLEYLEQKYVKELVVVGVHSAKFENEKDTENIRRAIQRYEIEHPVINDANMIIWRKYGVRSWPTLVVIDPEGNFCGFVSGEGHRKLLDEVIARLIRHHKAKGTLDETPVHFDLEREKLPPTPLRFPGKVLADPKGGRLFISDSNHNRIVIASLDGSLIDVIGSGAIGSRDGSWAEASFDHPQGMDLVDDKLYVADTENHLIRLVDLQKKTVSTLAGTGRQAPFGARGGRPLRRTALNSPWDLVHVDGSLYIAMAGPHQIWHRKIGTTTIEVYAGSGREDILNGKLADSAFAQPSAITTDGRLLYVADSEGSAIRQVPTSPRGEVITLVGPSELPQGRSLFEFGDIDGIGGRARLQHPLGLVYHQGKLYVADSYNHKIKRITLNGVQSKIETLFGDGTPGTRLDPPRFSEPAGISIAGNALYVADTNNHRILTADLESGTVKEFTVQGLKPPTAPESENTAASADIPATRLQPQRVAGGETLEFRVALRLPQGYKLNTLAPLSYRITADGIQSLVAEDHLDKRHRPTVARGEENTVLVSVPLAARLGKGDFELTLNYGYCRDGVGGLCKIKTSRWSIPLEVTSSAEQSVIELESRAEEETP